MLCLAGALPVVRALLVPDLNWCYRYMTSDSYDWISNGLFLAGEPVTSTMRPPGLPLLIAALWKAGALSFLPVVNFLFLGLSTAALFLLLRERHDGWIAALACWFFFANDAVQDLARYVMAETYGTPFLVLAALAFVRAGRDPRAYVAMGAALGAGVLFSYAAALSALGLAVAVLILRPADVRRRSLWWGVLAAGAPLGAWVAFRASYYRAHPGLLRHGVETLIRPNLSNLSLYAVALPAVLGLLVLPLYVAGAFRLDARDETARRYRAAVFAPLLALSAFWLFVYDWADRRFLVYLLPFLVCFLAEGLEWMRAFARRGRLATAGAAAFVVAALLWNQIRYPTYGFYFLALTPEHFLEAAMTQTPAQKTELHLTGARIARLHGSLRSAFSRGLFDWREKAPECPQTDSSFTCLATLKREADSLLRPGQPVGLFTPRGWPQDYWASTNRLANAWRRPVALPSIAEITLAGEEALPKAEGAHLPVVAHCGPYILVRTR